MIKIEYVENKGMALEVECSGDDLLQGSCLIVASLHTALASKKDMDSVALAKTFEACMKDDDFWRIVNMQTYTHLMNEDADEEEAGSED